MDKELDIKKLALRVGLVALLIIGLSSVGKLVEVNDAGVYQVKQSVGGELSVKFDAGPYFQGLGTITSYQASDILEFDKREGSEEPIRVRFQDGGSALVSGSVKIRLPVKDTQLLTIHKEFRSHDALKNTLLKPTFTEAVQQTAALMKSEESYSSRRSEFAALLEEQIRRGIFETKAVEVKEKDVDGNEFNDVNIVVQTAQDGTKIVRKTSPFLGYGVEVIQVIIKDIDYDDTIDALIAEKKKAEQQKVVAKANAEKSKQDAITAREKAAADVAIAKGNEEVEKIKAVTQAQKEYEVSVLNKKKAEEDAKAREIEGRADALVNQLKVNAGLTPQERAEFEVRKADVVSKNLSNIKLPGMMVIGGGNGGNAADPFTAIGIESLMRINNKLTNDK